MTHHSRLATLGVALLVLMASPADSEAAPSTIDHPTVVIGFDVGPPAMEMTFNMSDINIDNPVLTLYGVEAISSDVLLEVGTVRPPSTRRLDQMNPARIDPGRQHA